jgi:hypothetical protein
MQGSHISSFRLFLYLGIVLVAVAVILFPTRIPLQAQPGDVDYYGVGWLVAPIIATWGSASAVLGLVQSLAPKRRIESYLLPLLAFVSVGLAYAAYLAVVFGSGIGLSVGRGEPFFWLYFGLILAPSLLMYTSAAKYLRTKTETNVIFGNKKVRAVTFALLAAVPLCYTGGFFALMYLL